MTKNSDIEMRQPGMDKTGPVPVKPPSDTHACRAADPAAQRRPGGSAGHDAAVPNRAGAAGRAAASANPGLAPPPLPAGASQVIRRRGDSTCIR